MRLKDEEDIFKKIYYEEKFMIRNSKEYNNISKKMKKLESNILIELSEKGKKDFENYLEYIFQRESIDAEEQFEIGFKTAVKIIIRSLK